MSSELNSLRTKLKMETKQKLYKERQVCKLRNVERSYCEDLHTLKLEIEKLTEQLEDLKDKISETNYEISRLEIQKSAERAKFDISMPFLDMHRKQFQDKFEKEAICSELRHKEQLDIEAAELEASRQKQKHIDEQNEQHAREAKHVEGEIANIEQECTVLKKRNNAIMLKLRRKLVETEEARRQLMKHLGVSP